MKASFTSWSVTLTQVNPFWCQVTLTFTSSENLELPPQNKIGTGICCFHLNMVDFEPPFASRSSFLKCLPCEEKLHSLFCIGTARDCNIFSSRQHMQFHIDMKYGTNLAREILRRVLFIPNNSLSNHIVCSHSHDHKGHNFTRVYGEHHAWATNGLQIQSLEIRISSFASISESKTWPLKFPEVCGVTKSQ